MKMEVVVGMFLSIKIITKVFFTTSAVLDIN